jgi:glutathione S-transferase
MADVTIYGFPGSSYARTTRLACEEKGVTYEVEPMAPQSPELLAVQPHGYMPALRHGDRVIYETSAITRYIDEAFDGPALQPAELDARTRMNIWISAANHYYDRAMIRDIVIQRLVVPSRGGTPDEAMIAAAVEKLPRLFDILDNALGEHAYLAGDAVSLADLFMQPIVSSLLMTEEGRSAMAGRANVERWFGALAARPSVAAITPKPEADAAE